MDASQTMTEGTKSIEFLLGEISGKVDQLISGQEAQDNRHTHLEARLRVVESKQHWLAGAAAVAGVIGSHLWKFISGEH